MPDTTIKKHPAALFGLSLWGIALILVVIKALMEPGQHTVVDSYLLGAERWLQGDKLYSGPGGFIYMPTFAVLFAPIAQLPLVVVDVLWRFFIIGFYGWASYRLLQHLFDRKPELIVNGLGFFSLLALPIAFSGFRNGQMNVVLIAAMMLITCQIIEKRWTAAALLLALVMSLKPTFAVFFLLAVTLYKPLWLRTPAFLALFLAIPLVASGMEYGMAQYVNFIEMARSAMVLGMETPKWASLFNISMQVINVEVPETLQTLLKVMMAGVTWLTCCYAIRRFGSRNGALYMLTLAGCYHLLFNPRSVNTDYIILGSMLAFWFSSAILLWKDKAIAWSVGLISLGVLFAFDLSRLMIHGTTSWVNPLMAMGFVVLVEGQLIKGRVFFTHEGSNGVENSHDVH